jgi:competence protein ComEC
VRAAAACRDPVSWFVRRAGLARFTTFSCSLGLVLSALAGPKPSIALIGLVASLIAAITAVALKQRNHRLDEESAPARAGLASGWLVGAVLLVGLFSGWLLGGLRVAALEAGVLDRAIGQTVEAELVVTGPVRANAGWMSATAAVRGLKWLPGAAPQAASAGAGTGAGVGETVLLEVAPPESGLGAVENGAREQTTPAALRQGMIVAVRATIQEPEGPSESGYDQARRLKYQGIEVVLAVDDPGSMTVLGNRDGVAGWFDRLRASALERLSLGPDARVNEVLQGVVVGDTQGIDEGWMMAFRRSGTAHMLSVSGLHVAALAAIMMGLARFARAPRWAGFLLAAASALFLIPFVGASPPVIRSAVMIVVVITGYWVGRSRDQWQVLGLAAIVVLGLNPFALFDVGFQLSFAAFVGMLVLLGPLQRLFRRLPDAIGSSLAVSLAAGFGTAPVSLLVFGQTSLVSPLANLLVVPTLPLVTGLGMAAVFLGFVWSGLAVAMDTLASLPMTWTIQVSRLTAMAPVLTAADLGRALFTLLAGGVALPAALAVMGRRVRVPKDLPLPWFKRSTGWLKRRRPRNRRAAAALGSALVVCGLLAGGAAYPVLAGAVETVATAVHRTNWPAEVEVRVLDVGQGNAVLVRTPGGRALLFDGGSEGCGLEGQLHSLGVRKLDLVVISHPHADHFAGLLEALDGVEVEALIDQVQVKGVGGADTGSAAEGAEEAAAYLRLRAQLAADGCRYLLARSGDSAKVDQATVRFYAPAKPLVMADAPDAWALRGGTPTGDELNGASLAAVVSVGSIDFLLPGDAEADALESRRLPPVEVLVVPHHGSRGAVSEPLMRELAPSLAVVSVGKNNSFGHPNPGTMAVLRQNVGAVVCTDEAGWVSCKVTGDTIAITTERTPTR